MLLTLIIIDVSSTKIKTYHFGIWFVVEVVNNCIWDRQTPLWSCYISYFGQMFGRFFSCLLHKTASRSNTKWPTTIPIYWKQKVTVSFRGKYILISMKCPWNQNELYTSRTVIIILIPKLYRILLTFILSSFSGGVKVLLKLSHTILKECSADK